VTPRGLVLDPTALFNSNPLTLYRITRFKYANLSGEGAAKSPSRWNAPGEEAIYTGSEQGNTVLERLVHTPKDRIPDDLALIKLSLSGAWSRTGNGTILTDHTTGAEFIALHSIDHATKAISSFVTPFAIAIPSVIVPVWNVVLFPKRRGFWEHVSIQSVESFEFDPRLFPDNALLEIQSKKT